MNWPSEYSNEIFDMTQGNKIPLRGVTGRLVASKSGLTKCAYSIIGENTQTIPKGRGATCPSRLEF